MYGQVNNVMYGQVNNVYLSETWTIQRDLYDHEGDILEASPKYVSKSQEVMHPSSWFADPTYVDCMFETEDQDGTTGAEVYRYDQYPFNCQNLTHTSDKHSQGHDPYTEWLREEDCTTNYPACNGLYNIFYREQGNANWEMGWCLAYMTTTSQDSALANFLNIESSQLAIHEDVCPDGVKVYVRGDKPYTPSPSPPPPSPPSPSPPSPTPSPPSPSPPSPTPSPPSPSPPSPPPPLPPSSSQTNANGNKDPHLSFAHGGSADFRGENGSYYAMLSVPSVQFAVRTVDTTFVLPGYQPKLVHGSFFTDVSWTLRDEVGHVYGVLATSGTVDFTVIDVLTGKLITHKIGPWKEWRVGTIAVISKQLTTYVRAGGWEMNATRHPIYNHLPGSPETRFDIALRPLDSKPGLTSPFGTASRTCYPHGILGQSWDGDLVGVSGEKDDYNVGTEITTRAQAKGAIEGIASDYKSKQPFRTEFAYSRFYKSTADYCPPRNVTGLKGTKTAYGGIYNKSASSSEL